MDDIKTLREEVKAYVDAADIKVVRMMHAMLQIDAIDNNRNLTGTNIPMDDFGSFPKPEDGEGVLPGVVKQ